MLAVANRDSDELTIVLSDGTARTRAEASETPYFAKARSRTRSRIRAS